MNDGVTETDNETLEAIRQVEEKVIELTTLVTNLLARFGPLLEQVEKAAQAKSMFGARRAMKNGN